MIACLRFTCEALSQNEPRVRLAAFAVAPKMASPSSRGTWPQRTFHHFPILSPICGLLMAAECWAGRAGLKLECRGMVRVWFERCCCRYAFSNSLTRHRKQWAIIEGKRAETLLGGAKAWDPCTRFVSLSRYRLGRDINTSQDSMAGSRALQMLDRQGPNLCSQESACLSKPFFVSFHPFGTAS